MPDIKNVFTSGKMNADLDERLVPQGEYRSALNIEVTTSEKESAGVVKNVRGNKAVGQYEHNTVSKFHYGDSIGGYDNIWTLGSITNELNNKFYWLTVGEEVVSQAVSGDNPSNYTLSEANQHPNGFTGFLKKSIIFEGRPGNVKEIDPVFVDISQIGIPTTGLESKFTPKISSTSTHEFISVIDARYLRKNMLVRAICMTSDGEIGNHYSAFVSIQSIDVVPDPNYPHAGSIRLNAPQIFFPTVTEVLFYVFEKPLKDQALKFNKETLITGLNIIDGMLFWTDDKTEPKKINIERCKLGTNNNADTQTRLIVNEELVTPKEIIVFQPYVEMAEKHVTVIRSGPKKAPSYIVNVGGRKGEIEGVATMINSQIASGYIKTFHFFNTVSYGPGTVTTQPLNFKEGDEVLFQNVIDEEQLPLPQNYIAKGLITDIVYPASDPTKSICKVKITWLSEEASSGDQDYRVRLSEETRSLFELKFSRFAIRYKYEDGEYSAPGPFTDVVFEPDNYRYQPKDAYNFGMVNTITQLSLTDFISPNIPEDVVQVDILYKEEKSPNIYSIDIIKKDDAIRAGEVYNFWTSPGTAGDLNNFPNTYTGYYEIKSENIYAALPEEQTLRHWDNVPLLAKSQEIVANRLVYANYVQGHEMVDFANQSIKPQISARRVQRAGNWRDDGDTIAGRKSLKSLRQYKLGVVYLDNYGRQSPVFTDIGASFNVPKLEAVNSNQIECQIISNPPKWAEYYKIFVKEPTDEYYNLAMDRIYEAGDDNVWLSFPSAERNKVDEDTYLILKKRPDVKDEFALVLEKAKYKVIAIENEAPDFIKTRYKRLGQVEGLEMFSDIDDSGNVIEVNIAETPQGANNKRIRFLRQEWEKDGGENDEDEVLKARFIQLSDGGGLISKRYELSSIELLTNPASYVATIKGDGIRAYDMDWLSGINPPITTGTVINGQTYNMPGGLQLRLYSEEIKNLPEFDGRFFVKIRKDQSVINELYSLTTSSNLVTVASAYTCYFADKWAPMWKGTADRITGIVEDEFVMGKVTSPTSLNTTNALADAYTTEGAVYTSTGGYTAGLVGAMHRHSDWWRLLNKHDNAVWFIDQAFFALQQQYGSNRPSRNNPNRYKWGMGFGRGIYDCANGSVEAFMELSFSGIPYSGNNRHNFEDPGQWLVGEEANPHTVNQKPIVDRLFNGSKFRWANDPEGIVYTITSAPQRTARFNHTSWYEAAYGNVFHDEQVVSLHPHLTPYGGFIFAQGATLENWVEDNDGNPDDWSNEIDNYSNTIFTSFALSPTGTFVTNSASIVSAEFAPWGLPYDPARRDQYQNPETWAFCDPNRNARAYFNTAYWPFPIDSSSPGDFWDFKVNTTSPLSASYNTQAKIESYNLGIGNGYSPLSSGSNRRVTWKFKVSPNPLRQNWNPLERDAVKRAAAIADNLPYPDANRNSNIVFLKWDDGDSALNSQSSSPAIFETEPKENVDLDIYHETNSIYPIYLNNRRGYEFAPVGSYVTCSSTLPPPYTGTSVLPPDSVVHSWDDTKLKIWSWIQYENDVTAGVTDEPGIVRIQVIDPSTNNPPIGMVFNDEFKFSRPDGGYTTAILKSNISYNVADVNGKVKELVFYRTVHKNAVGLSWNNCYSFRNGVESDRIRDDYNAAQISSGPKISTVSLRQYKEERRKSGLIYSGLYNSKSGTNKLNEFISGTKITKDLNPVYGSIQKLFTRNTDLVAFCEDRVIKILANKDALYNADGNPALIASNAVLGQAQPFVGDYGISKNPESFASESYRCYFSDKSRSAIIRLSLDGLEPISDHGMSSWFNNNLRFGKRIIGSYDMEKKEYNISIQSEIPSSNSIVQFTYPDWVDLPLPDDSNTNMQE